MWQNGFDLFLQAHGGAFQVGNFDPKVPYGRCRVEVEGQSPGVTRTSTVDVN